MATKVGGKTKAWRKTPKQMVDGKLERYGRKFRNVMARMNATKAYPTAIILTLLKNGGITTPVFDKAMLSMTTPVESSTENEVSDVEILSENLQVSVPA